MYFHLRFYMCFIFHLGKEYFNQCEYLNHFATFSVILIKLVSLQIQSLTTTWIVFDSFHQERCNEALIRISLPWSFKDKVCVLFHYAVVISHYFFPLDNEGYCFSKLNLSSHHNKMNLGRFSIKTVSWLVSKKDSYLIRERGRKW